MHSLGLVSGEVLIEFASALDVELSEVLLVSAVDSRCAKHVENDATAQVESDGVLSAVVEQTLEA